MRGQRPLGPSVPQRTLHHRPREGVGMVVSTSWGRWSLPGVLLWLNYLGCEGHGQRLRRRETRPCGSGVRAVSLVFRWPPCPLGPGGAPRSQPCWGGFLIHASCF